MTDYAYPPHCHDVWTILILDDGVVRYDLDQHERTSGSTSVNVLPPFVVHDGRPLAHSFRKRVLYLDDTWLSHDLIGAAVDDSVLDDARLRRAIERVHAAIDRHDDLAAETGLAIAAEHLGERMGVDTPRVAHESTAAHRFRRLLDDHAERSVTLLDAARVLDRNPTHLARSFAATFGISPHAYVTGRRVDAARRLLLDGMPAADVAAAVGFHDQAHLTRHFRRHTSTTPARFARSGRR